MLKPSEVSRSRVCVALRVMTSTSPDCNATNRCCAVVGVNLTFWASPNMATAIALQRSTSRPVHLPWLSEKEKPASPVLTAHCTKPLALTASKVWPADAGSAATHESAATAARDLNVIGKPPVGLLGTTIAKATPFPQQHQGSSRSCGFFLPRAAVSAEERDFVQRHLPILPEQHERLTHRLRDQHS